MQFYVLLKRKCVIYYMLTYFIILFKDKEVSISPKKNVTTTDAMWGY